LCCCKSHPLHTMHCKEDDDEPKFIVIFFLFYLKKLGTKLSCT
jgi:hypothetical protein